MSAFCSSFLSLWGPANPLLHFLNFCVLFRLWLLSPFADIQMGNETSCPPFWQPSLAWRPSPSSEDGESSKECCLFGTISSRDVVARAMSRTQEEASESRRLWPRSREWVGSVGKFFLPWAQLESDTVLHPCLLFLPVA